MNDNNKIDLPVYAKFTRATSFSAPRTYSTDQKNVDRLKKTVEYWKTMLEEQQKAITKHIDTITKTLNKVLKMLDSLLVETDKVTQEDQNSFCSPEVPSFSKRVKS